MEKIKDNIKVDSDILKLKRNKTSSFDNSNENGKKIDSFSDVNNIINSKSNTLSPVDDVIKDDKKQALNKVKKSDLKKFFKGKKKKGISSGNVFIYASFNNVRVTIADLYGNVIVWATSGSSGFKGPKKSTPYAGQIAAEKAGKKAQEMFGLKEANVTLAGSGPGRDSALRGLNSVGIAIKLLRYKSAVAHNGCRRKKTRRV